MLRAETQCRVLWPRHSQSTNPPSLLLCVLPRTNQIFEVFSLALAGFKFLQEFFLVGFGGGNLCVALVHVVVVDSECNDRKHEDAQQAEPPRLPEWRLHKYFERDRGSVVPYAIAVRSHDLERIAAGVEIGKRDFVLAAEINALV